MATGPMTSLAFTTHHVRINRHLPLCNSFLTNHHHLFASHLDGLSDLTLHFLLLLGRCRLFFELDVGGLSFGRLLVLVFSAITSLFGDRFTEIRTTVVKGNE